MHASMRSFAHACSDAATHRIEHRASIDACIDRMVDASP
jgi:hypothetical protein